VNRTLYHYTSRRQLPQILSAGELLMTPNPHTPPKWGKIPTLWLTDRDGVDHYGDTLAYGLNLNGPQQGLIVDRIEVRFTVSVPSDEVPTWDEFCDFYDLDKYERRRLAKWPSRSEWWIPFFRSITSDEWVEVGVGRDVWSPMFAPDEDVQQVQETGN
jgi:hypothetical protein